MSYYVNSKKVKKVRRTSSPSSLKRVITEWLLIWIKEKKGREASKQTMNGQRQERSQETQSGMWRRDITTYLLLKRRERAPSSCSVGRDCPSVSGRQRNSSRRPRSSENAQKSERCELALVINFID